jgi:hypothetical protein
VSLSTSSGPLSNVIGADAVEVVAFPGLVDGTFAVNALDSVYMAQVEGKVNTGFAAFHLADPRLLGDVNGDATIKAGSSGLVTRYGNSLTTPQIPWTGNPEYSLSGSDPTVSIPSTLAVGGDGSVTVPVNIDDPHPAGSEGMVSATLAVSYDPAVWSVSTSDIRLGSVPESGSGWTLQSVVDPAAGQIGVTIWSVTPITSSTAGSLVTIVFHRSDLAATGTTTIDLVPSVDPDGSGMIYTQVADAQGPLTLTPAPTDGYDPQIDGLVTLAGVEVGATGFASAAGATGPASAAGATGLASAAGATGSASAAGAADASSAGVATALPVMPHLTASVVAASAPAGASTHAVRVPRQAADGLFAALGGGAESAEWAMFEGSGADAALPALAAQVGGGSAQASLDNLLWEGGDPRWLDGGCEWLL